MNIQTQDKIFSSLNLSKDQALQEIALLSAYQKLSEFQTEVAYFEKKYKKSFKDFDKDFKKMGATFEVENDWLSWKFATEGQLFWQELTKKISK